MAVIAVNYKDLRDFAAAIENYCTIQNNQMQQLDADIITMLTTGWLGADAKEFKHKWETVNDKDSTAVKFRNSLDSFGKSLVYCANEYQMAQEITAEAANRLLQSMT